MLWTTPAAFAHGAVGKADDGRIDLVPRTDQPIPSGWRATEPLQKGLR